MSLFRRQAVSSISISSNTTPAPGMKGKPKSYLITEEPGVLVGLVDDVPDLAVGVDAADHALLAVDSVRKFFLLKNDKNEEIFLSRVARVS
jgi:hypothetical protein